MTHQATGVVLQHPTATRPATGPTRVDARTVFGRNVRPGHRGWLWTVDVDGVQYLTDRYVTIRADRLMGVDGHRFDTLSFPPRNIARVLEALAAPLSGAMATARFEVELIAALYAGGAGILPLAGDRVPDVHAVVYRGARIGLVTPIPTFRAESALGAIPGIPPFPAGIDWTEAAR